MSTLLEAKVWDLNFDPVQRDMVLDIIDKMVAGGGGLVGFASGIEPDSDDSAKVSLVYSLCGRSSLAPQIIDRFDATDCLQWYAHEREPCVSANAQALLALTHDTAKSEQNAKVVEKITKFLCASWARNRGWLIDKRVRSPQAPSYTCEATRIMIDLCNNLPLSERTPIHCVEIKKLYKLLELSYLYVLKQQ